MTEEQFIVADCSTCVFDKVTEEEYVCISREEAFLVCNRLNALCKEKEELLDERNYFERKKCEYFNDWNNAHLDNIQLRQENKQLKEQIKIYEKFLDGNDLDIEWDLFCTADVCHEEEDTECKDCKYMRWTDD